MALAFVVTEEKCLVLYDRASQRAPELVLTQFIEPARCSQGIFRIHGIVTEIFVQRTVQIVSSAFGNDIDNATNGASKLSAVAAIHDPEFLHRIFGRCGLLNTGSG